MLSHLPSGWTQPDLSNLPPGEALRGWPFEVWGRPAKFPPPSAPGFQAAWRMGILPAPVPDQPPTPVPGLSSWDRTRLALGLFTVAFTVAPILGAVLHLGAGMVVVIGVPFLAALGLLNSIAGRDRAEHAAGYTSTRVYSGLWRLARDGRVLRAPAPGTPPPGWYPSPYYPGLLQRWDGPGWRPLPEDWWHHEHLYFRRPDVPFL